MSWLNKPVTWKWYLGIMVGAYAISYFVLSGRRRMEAEDQWAQLLKAREANQKRAEAYAREGNQGGGVWKQ